MSSKVFRFENASIDKIPEYSEFNKLCFPHNKHMSEAYLQWLYKDNPAGEMIGMDAYDGDQLVGHGATIPCEFSYQGTPISCVFGLNFAVHPNFQARGIPNKIDLLSEIIAGKGHSLLLGVANQFSTLVVVRRHGFKFVSTLDAAVGYGSPYDFEEDIADQGGFRHDWRSETLQWRINNPLNKISLRRNGNALAAYASARKYGLVAYAPLPVVEGVPLSSPSVVQSVMPNVFIGISGSRRLRKTYQNIPVKFRPSPLNFVVRNLKKDDFKINKNEAHLTFLDWDAF